MNDRNIENFMKLAANHQGKGDRESRSDRYYRKIYQNLENGKILSWNWVACGLIPWLIFRKMYLAATLIVSLGICLTRDSRLAFKPAEIKDFGNYFL